MDGDRSAVTNDEGSGRRKQWRYWSMEAFRSPVSFTDERLTSIDDTINLITRTIHTVSRSGRKSAAADLDSILSQRPVPIYTRCFRAWFPTPHSITSPLTPRRPLFLEKLART